mgnify:CR=1 FL=1
MRLLFLDRSTKLMTVHDLKTRARGGMVTSLFRLSDALAEKGHDVQVVADIENAGRTDIGTWWQPWGQFDPREERWDVLICNRGVDDGHPLIRVKHRVLWTHDLPHNGFLEEPRTIKAFSATVFMSQYAEDIWGVKPCPIP